MTLHPSDLNSIESLLRSLNNADPQDPPSTINLSLRNKTAGHAAYKVTQYINASDQDPKEVLKHLLDYARDVWHVNVNLLAHEVKSN